MGDISLDRMSFQDLMQIRNSLEQDLQGLQASLQQLGTAKGKYQASAGALDSLEEGVEGKEALLPLTGSLYAPGKLLAQERILVDLGTGYYAEKSISDARAFMLRKVSYLEENIKMAMEVAETKQTQMEAVMLTMQVKQQQAQQAQQAQ